MTEYQSLCFVFWLLALKFVRFLRIGSGEWCFRRFAEIALKDFHISYDPCDQVEIIYRVSIVADLSADSEPSRVFRQVHLSSLKISEDVL